MRMQYGLQTVSQAKNGGKPVVSQAKSRNILDENHGFTYKRVPMQSKDGHLLSDLASPKESVYAKRKLISKERKEHALKT